MTREVLAIFAGCVVSSALLLAAHLGLYKRLPDEGAYTVGVACLGVGLITTGALLESWVLVIAFGCIAGSGGALIVSARWIRRQLDVRDRKPIADRLLKIGERADAAVSGRSDDRRN